MKRMSRLAAVCAAAFSTAAFAADPCSSYKWDVTPEVALFATAPAAVTVGTDAGNAPAIEAGRHYALALHPQQAVRFAVAPTKRMLDDGAYGGILKVKVPAAGLYRVAVDAGFWLDVIHDGKAVETVDFNGVRECAGPRKIVVFQLPADTELQVQIAAHNAASARLTVTPVATAEK